MPANSGKTAPSTFAEFLAGSWYQLPQPHTDLIGREADVSAARDRLAVGSLVTVTGVGGVGKTRVAVEVAGSVLAEGTTAAFVDLGAVTDGVHVVDAVFERAPRGHCHMAISLAARARPRPRRTGRPARGRTLAVAGR